MQYNRLNDPNALINLIKALEKRVSGVETKGTGNIGFVGTDGVELRIGQNPDGTVGITPFIGDTTPPPVATFPDASSGPGFITVTWDGFFVNNDPKPADFVHLNVIGHKVVDGNITLSAEVGIIRNPMDSCLVGTDVAAVGEDWKFSFVSEDYNGNLSDVSGFSPTVKQKSFAADALITDALEGLQQDYINAQNAAASAQNAANAAQQDADQLALDLTKKGTVYTQSVQPAADMNGLWIDKGHNNVPRRYLGIRRALFVNVGGGASVGARLTALGWNVTTVTAMPTLDDASQYDLVAFDAGYAGLSSAYGTLASSLLDRGVSVFTSGNDTTSLPPLFTGGVNRGTPKNTIRPVGSHPAATGWAEYADGDLNFYLTGVRPEATVTGVTLVTSLGTDQPLNVVWEHPTTFARWTHVQTYATPVSVLNAHLNWISDNWVAIQDQAVVASIAAAQLKADQAFNNAATAASAAGTAQNTADSKNRSWYQDDQPAGTSHKVGDSWFDTNDGYKLRTWNGSIWQTTQDSALAQITAESKGRTYTQNTVPPVEARNDKNLWIDTSAGVGLYVTKYWEPTANSGAGAWVALKDKDAAAAQDTADSKGETIYSDTEPAVSKRLPQNTWIDTTGGVNIQKRWFNNAWTPVVDYRIPSTAAAVTAVSSRVDSVSALADAKGTYTQSVAPPLAARLPQTIWNDTSLGLDKVVVKYWDGNAWTAVTDKAATDAQSTADAKGETIYSTTEPAAAKRLPQNTWVDTSGGLNISKRWDGFAWVVVVDSRIPSTAAAVTAVDSKVTSVSAAASAALSTVDSRVSSVSAVAESKGEIIYSPTTPSAAKSLPQNQWVDTTGGLNIVKRWNTATGTWVIASDQRIDTTAAAVTAVDTRVTGVSAAAGTAIGAVDTRVTSVSAAASGQINNVDARVTGVSATAGSLLSSLDTKVTGVSAAANTQIGTVDSRVTGVSATAGSLLSTLDTKVTSVSAAASGQISTVDSRVTGVSAAAGSAVSSLDTKVTGVSAAASTQIGTVDSRVTGVSSTAGSLLSSLDTKVTGVSAAANTQIGTVDTRVTGVSAAAGSAITNVDTRVTGVSAAAGSAVSSLDTKVTGVSAAANTQIGTVDSRVTGVSATAGSLLSSLDTKVTGVSATANTQIGSVDTRVTGVSAAAGSAITNVDTRVTGVSAAASSEATAKASAAQAAAIAAAALDATQKADAAKAVALEAAKNAENKVVNGSFELDFDAWNRVGSTASGIDSAVARSGTKSFFTTGGGDINQPGFPVTVGQVWRYEWFYKTDAAYVTSNPGGLRLQKSSDNGATWSDAGMTALGTNVPNWTFQQIEYTVAAGVTHLRARIAFAYTGGAKAWMDDIRLTDVSQIKILEADAQTKADTAKAQAIAAAATDATNKVTVVDTKVSSVSAAVTSVDSRVTGVSAAAGSLVSTLDTKVTGVSAAANTQIGTVDSRVTGVSAAAGTAITNVDTRVTGVSSAAGSAITNVDTRVTGVSAAAGSAITNVDTKVTGVSAAANTQIGNVDTRVTGVSAAAGSAIGSVDTRVTGVSAAASGQIGNVDSRVTGVSAAAASGITTVDSRVSSVSASVTSVDSRVTGVSAAAGSAISTVDARVTGVSSAAGTAIGTVDARVTGVSSAASGQINTVDSRVSGVSAAASSGLNTVDSRVTSVSAAASGQINTVDSRVTGVSAAAGSAIGTVDARVTGVSAAASAGISAVASEVDQVWASSRSYHNDGTSVADIQVMQGVAPTVVNSTTGMGGKAIQKSGTGNGWWHDNRAKQAYDPTALYRLTIRVRTVTPSTLNGKGFYFGFAGLAADGTTFVNVTGANSYSSQQWVYSNVQIPTDGSWTDYVAYYRGLSATTPSGAGTSIQTARLMHADTRYVVPSMLLDYSSGNGVWEVSHWSIDVIDSAGYTALIDAATKSVTYYDPNMPTGGTYKKGDLWIDTDDGNKIYAHNGTTFVNAQDTAITSAASSASAAMTAANGKNKVIWSTSAASGTTGYSAGDVWFQTASGIITGQWEFTTSWQSRTIDNAVIANLNAGKLTAGTIAAARIGASTISAEKLTLGDLTNLAADGSFLDLTKLNWIGSGVVTVSAGEPNRLMITTAASGNNDQGNRNSFQVTEGEQLYGEMWVYGAPTNVGGGGPNLHLTVTMANGTTQWPQFDTKTRAAVQGQWVPLRGSVTIPAGAKSARVEPAIGFSADAVGNVYYIRDVVVRRKNTGNLIVDGAITANSAIIANGAIGNAQIADLNADKLTAGTVAAARLNADDIRTKLLAAAKINAVDIIASGSISSSTGVFGVLDAASINAGTLAAARLNADDIRTKLLAAAKINAVDIIASGSISSSTGLFGVIDASSINAGTLSAARIGAGSITASALSVTMGGNNLVANSSFEADSNNDGLADGWTVWTRGAGDAGRVFTNTRVAGLFPGSTFAQRVTTTTVTNTEQSSIQGTQYFAVKAGDKVTLSLYCRANSTQTFSVSLRCEDDGGVYKGDANFTAPWDTTTQRYFSVVTIPAGSTKAKVTITTPGAPAAGSWFEVDGIKAELGDMLSAWSPMATELLPGTINATMLTATAIDGKVITGATVQSETTANRGIKLTSSELAGWDTNGQKNFSLTSTGTLAIRGAIESGSTITGAAITGGTLTGGTVQTETTASRGIKLTTSELAGWDTNGQKNFSLTSTGTLAIRGAIESGSTITGAAISGGTLTGGTVQTETTASRGIKLTTTELAGWDTNGQKNFSLTSTGTLAIRGAIESGSTITGATVTGGTVQSESTALRGIKLTSAELAGYDTNGQKNFSLSSAGSLAIRGEIMSGSTITGATLAAAGGGIVTNSAASRGVKLQDTGITAYDSIGNLTFKVDAATGLVEAPGIKAGSISSAALAATAIDGKTITGATIQTDSTPVSAARGIKLTSSELGGWDTNGQKNFSLTSAGALYLRGEIKSGSTIEGAKLTGTQGLETSTIASTGVKINNAGIKAYDAGNNLTFHLDAGTGLIEVPGIKTNTLKGDAIQAASLTADKLLVSDFTNLLDDPQILGAGWIKGGSPASASIVFDTNEKTNVWRFNGASTQVDVTNKNVIPVNTALYLGKPTDQFWLSVRTYSTLAVSGYLRVLFFSDTGAQVGYSDITIPAASGWTTRTMDIGGTVAYPAGTKTMKIQPIIGSNALTGTGYILYGTMSLRRKNGGELLVDGSLDAKTITGSLIQTDNTAIDTAASRGIKLTTSGLFGYDGGGNKVFNLASNGSLTLTGTIKAGSTIEGALLTGTTGIQTSTGATSGVKVTNSGIKAWDTNNNLTFNLDASTGYLELPGLKANSINGDRLVSGSVTSEQVRIGDFSNHFINGFGELGSGKGFGAGLIYDTADKPAEVTGVFKSTAGQGTHATPTLFFDVTPNTEYISEVWIKASLPNSKIFIELRDQAGNHGTTNTNEETGASEGDYILNNETVPTVWTKYVIKTVTKATTTRLRVGSIYFNHTNGTERNAVVSLALGFRRRLAGSLIVDGAITTDHMLSGTIDGGVIKAGSLTSTEIKAKSITVDDLVVSSTDNLVVEADFGNNGSSWDLTPAYKFIMPDRGRGSLPALRIVGGTIEVMSKNLANKISVDPNNRYRASIWVRSTEALAAGKVKMYLRCYTTATAYTDITAVSSPALVVNTWTEVSGMVPVLPAGTIAVEVIVSAQNSADTTWTEIDYVSLTRAMDGKLVVDGSITAASVAASSIGAQHLMANSITASAINADQLWADSSWLGEAGASSLKLSTKTTAVSSVNVSASGVSSIYWDQISSEVNSQGIRVYNTTTDSNGVFVDEDPIIQLGTFNDDYFQINSGDSGNLINMDNSGTVTAKTIEAEDIRYRGMSLERYIDTTRPRGMVAWGQVLISSSMAVAGGAEVGLFEIAWDAQDADDATLDDELNLQRMYQFNLNDFLINVGGAGVYGLRLRYTTNDTAPTINSALLGFKYFRTDVAGLVGSGSFTRIIGSNNGAKLRVLVSLYSSGTNANVYTGTGQTHLYSTVVDLGTSMPGVAVASTGGGTPYNGAPAVPPPTAPKVTRTVEYGYYGSRSYLPSGAAYNYNTAKAYQGLSPAGYGNLNSIYTFNQNFQTLLSGATVNDIWVYVYFEHWYNNAGGTARIRLHNQLTTPGSYTGVFSTIGIDSGSWPKGAGRWVRLPTSTYEGFKSGNLYKGFALVGDGTYNTYGIANNARIRIRYTK